MNWKALKNMKCPSCNGDLQHVVPRGIECKTCPFVVSHKRFEEIVASMYKPKQFRSETDNFSDLNNLGRKPVSEDFSDSHYLD